MIKILLLLIISFIFLYLFYLIMDKQINNVENMTDTNNCIRKNTTTTTTDGINTNNGINTTDGTNNTNTTDGINTTTADGINTTITDGTNNKNKTININDVQQNILNNSKFISNQTLNNSYGIDNTLLNNMSNVDKKTIDRLNKMGYKITDFINISPTVSNIKSNYNNFLNGSLSNYLINNLYELNENIEITKLPLCNKKLFLDFGVNTNNIINNNISLLQNIVNPYIHTAEFNGENYNMISVMFKKSQLSWNGIPIGLEFHIVFNNFKDIQNLSIVIPLDLISNTNNNIETFQNVLYDNTFGIDTLPDPIYDNTVNQSEVEINPVIKDYFNSSNKFSKGLNSFPDINDHMFDTINSGVSTTIETVNKYNLNITYDKPYDINKITLNNLIFSSNHIPIYQCCNDTIGAFLQLDFSNVETILKNTKNFYVLEEESGNLLLISDPSPFSGDIGLLIRNSIIDDINTKFLKTSTQ